MLKRLSEWLALTTAERNVILFLTGTFLLGLGIRLYQETFPNTPRFDYRASDSSFAALSTAAANEESDMEGEARININTATKTELMKLPGIGQVTADRILAYRKAHGGFKSADELRKVKGISVRKLEQIRNLITVRNAE
jgi:competence protein ComEA